MRQCVAITGHSAIALKPLLRRNSIVMKHMGLVLQTKSRDAPVLSDWVPVGLGTGRTGYRSD